MAQDKIRISWDEVQSASVNDKVKQQQALAHAQEHLRTQQLPTTLAPVRGGGRLFYNALVYLSLFGLSGGVLAWAFGELAFSTIHSNIDEFEEFALKENEIIAKQKRGQITQDEANQALERLDSKYRKNPYVTIALDSTLNNLEKGERAKRQRERTCRRSFGVKWFGFRF